MVTFRKVYTSKASAPGSVAVNDLAGELNNVVRAPNDVGPELNDAARELIDVAREMNDLLGS